MEIVYEEKDLPKVARNIIRFFKAGDIIGFSGDLAAGKTSLIKAILDALGYPRLVNSPTFVIEHRYPLKASKTKFSQVIHLDFYRLKAEELTTLDWEDYLNGKDLVLIEWPEIAAAYLPKGTKHLKIGRVNEKTRRLTLSENFAR